MITSDAWRGNRYAVLGLARSGRATVAALIATGAEVVAWDSDETARAAIASGPNVTLADPLSIDLAGFAGVVVSPGVPLNRHPIAAVARAAGVPLIGDIELFAQARPALPPHRIVGITGTNGKSTTTALVYHILACAGVPTAMGGNIGLPILGQVPLPANGVYVLELSSYQLDLTHSLACDVAVLLNVTPDHLDRYDGFADYAAAKERLFTLQHADGIAVIACDDDPSRMIASRVAHRLHRVHAVDVADQSGWPALTGPHNAQNIAVARCVARELGIADAVIAQAMASYPGLPDRMERVRDRAGVAYVNDSKATNPASAAPALAAFDRVRWIVGGRAKGIDLDACRPRFDHVVHAYAIGEAGPAFATLLTDAGVATTQSGTLANAVLHAARDAVAGDTVLLSPACASFDQFADFEARGAAFRAAVEAL